MHAPKRRDEGSADKPTQLEPSYSKPLDLRTPVDGEVVHQATRLWDRKSNLVHHDGREPDGKHEPGTSPNPCLGEAATRVIDKARQGTMRGLGRKLPETLNLVITEVR